MARDKAIGIDLGTTYSCAGVWHNERVEIITNDQGNRTTPSIVAFNETERLVGEGAKNQIISNPHNTVCNVKRLMGRRFSDPVLQSDISHWPFSVVEGSNGRPEIQVTYRGESKTFAPQEISAMVLSKMKEIAKTFLKFEVKNAVVTVPAYFNNSQRQATMDAAHLAGLNVLQLLNEPTAAAIAYGLDTKTYSSPNGKNILVFDVGGGTFDVSLINITRGTFQVRAVGGDAHLGGEDFDNRLLNHFVKEFQRKHKKEIDRNARALSRLRAVCERAKRSLSAATETTVEIDCLYDSSDFYSKISRASFEDLNNDLFNKCIDGVRLCLANARMAANEVDEVVLVGGSTRIPKIQQLIEGLFGQKKLCRSINQDEAVAYGAAVQAAVLIGQSSDVVLQDVTPLSLGVKLYGGAMRVIIPKNTHVPVKKVKTFSTRFPKIKKLIERLFGQKKLCRSINQDKAVAYGAVVQAAVLIGQSSEVVLQDVTPLSLGVEADGGVMAVIIPKNTHVPVKKVKTVYTAADYQTVIPIIVYEGERTTATDNNLLGSFKLSGLPADLRGKEKVDVSFEIDTNGILKVSAKNSVAGENSIIISKDNCGLSKDEIIRMKFDAERYRGEDEQVALKHRARKALEHCVYERRNRAREQSLRGTIRAAEAHKIEAIMKSTIDWIKENHGADTEEFKKKLGEVKRQFNALTISTPYIPTAISTSYIPTAYIRITPF